ncbi:conserved hypothetical protein [Ricinus communis]|uniref:Uncharacterized protein n=1 Tax=Ricinus communis TaxID=3988 RepID=B9TBV0_RICCO|nr:conserved hypothetical protein [Ricinus communis]
MGLVQHLADLVVGAVTQDGGHDQGQHHQVDIVGAGGGQRTGDEQQRVARQDGRDHQAGFAEDDQEQDQEQPGSIGSGQLGQVTVDMDDEIDQEQKNIHKA